MEDGRLNFKVNTKIMEHMGTFQEMQLVHDQFALTLAVHACLTNVNGKI